MTRKRFGLLNLIACLFVFCLFLSSSLGQTTGKISGVVKDAISGDPLPGAQIVIQSIWFDGIEVDLNSKSGAVADINGDYFIINVDPGQYTISARMMGYKTVSYEKVNVSVNRTTRLDFEMEETEIKGEEVLVTANQISVKKDQTNSVRNVSASTIQSLPVEEMGDVVKMQAGIVNGHFRGGRNTEVSYLIDGMQIDQSFDRGEQTFELEKESVQDLEVITGTFNAEYGRAMSGIVNMVTKDGRDEFHGSASAYLSNYYTGNDDVFIGLDKGEINRNQDYKLQLEGPVYENKITFFTNVRYNHELGYLNGTRRFNVDDYTDFNNKVAADTGIYKTPWDAFIDGDRFYSEHTGDNDFVSMDEEEKFSFMGKLSFKLTHSFKFSTLYQYQKEDYSLTTDGERGYSHSYKYNPDGLADGHEETDFFMIQFNHLLTNSLFYDLKLSYNRFWQGEYLFKDPLSPRYVSQVYSREATDGFVTGGQDFRHMERTLSDMNAKFDITWQMNNRHSIKTGFIYTRHELDNDEIVIRNANYDKAEALSVEYDSIAGEMTTYPFVPEILPDSSVSMDVYEKEPYEFSGYFQDKMEFNSMVVNLGVRLDYFNSNTEYPSQYRNPSNQIYFENSPERMSVYEKADPRYQISPRLGLSYTLGNQAVLHFSYGHFFQMPPLYALYQNHHHKVPTSNFQTIMGNPNIEAEKTVQYEMGIWQELAPGMGLELNVFYRDIYNLLSTKVITTYNQIKYGLYSNLDYGNVKGLELKYDYVFGPYSLYCNYTLQYTRGNAENPKSSFSRAGNNLDPIPYLYPMPWDQRHTVNVSVNYNQSPLSFTLTAYWNSGAPYTLRPISESPLSKQNLNPNEETKPSNYTVDFKGHYDFTLNKRSKFRVYLMVYNLLDRLNEMTVDPTTGRAYSGIITPTLEATFRSDFNDINDHLRDPSMYSAPREIKFGIGYIF